MDWKRKLTSRKFWLAVASLVTAILVMFNVPEITIEQTTTLVMAFAAVIAYIIGEGLVDASNKTDDKGSDINGDN